MEIRENDVIIRVDSANAWAVKDLGYLYCCIFDRINGISNFSTRKAAIEKCLIYLITCVQKLGKYSGVVYNNFYAEKMEIVTRVDHVAINITSLYAKDYKNVNLFLGVLLDGIVGIKNAIERHKFIVKIMDDSLAIFSQLKTHRSLDEVVQLAQ